MREDFLLRRCAPRGAALPGTTQSAAACATQKGRRALLGVVCWSSAAGCAHERALGGEATACRASARLTSGAVRLFVVYCIMTPALARACSWLGTCVCVSAATVTLAACGVLELCAALASSHLRSVGGLVTAFGCAPNTVAAASGARALTRSRGSSRAPFVLSNFRAAWYSVLLLLWSSAALVAAQSSAPPGLVCDANMVCTASLPGYVLSTNTTPSGIAYFFLDLSTTTFTPPSWAKRITAWAIGAGGGGGGVGGSGNAGTGCGGGAGGVAFATWNITPPAGAVTFTVGAFGAPGAALVASSGTNGGDTTLTFSGNTITGYGGGAGGATGSSGSYSPAQGTGGSFSSLTRWSYDGGAAGGSGSCYTSVTSDKGGGGGGGIGGSNALAVSTGAGVSGAIAIEVFYLLATAATWTAAPAGFTNNTAGAAGTTGSPSSSVSCSVSSTAACPRNSTALGVGGSGAGYYGAEGGSTAYAGGGGGASLEASNAKPGGAGGSGVVGILVWYPSLDNYFVVACKAGALSAALSVQHVSVGLRYGRGCFALSCSLSRRPALSVQARVSRRTGPPNARGANRLQAHTAPP